MRALRSGPEGINLSANKTNGFVPKPPSKEINPYGPPRFVPGGPISFMGESFPLPRIDLLCRFSLDCDPPPMTGPFLRSARPRPRCRTRPCAGADRPALRGPAGQTRTSGVPRVTARPSVHSWCALPRRVQVALKPAAKTLGLHRIFMRGMGLKQAIAHGASKRMQVVARACQLDTDEHHRGLAHRTGGAAANWSEWKDGRQALRLGHDASLER
jgi:hypothetical protein